MTRTINYEDGLSIEIRIEPDAEAYSVWQDHEHAEFTTADSRSQFWDNADRAGLSTDNINELANGHIVVIDHRIFAGLEKYSHGGDVYARCGHGGFPDRRWDVSPIVGWIEPHHVLDKDVIESYLKDPEKNEEQLLKRIDQEIETLNDAISGNCWGYVAELYDKDGNLLDDDSCWGYLGDEDYCVHSAEDAANWMVENYRKQNPPIEYHI